MHLIDVICAAVGRATMYCIVSFYVYSNIIRCRLQCKFLNEFALLRVFATLNRLLTVFFLRLIVLPSILCNLQFVVVVVVVFFGQNGCHFLYERTSTHVKHQVYPACWLQSAIMCRFLFYAVVFFFLSFASSESLTCNFDPDHFSLCVRAQRDLETHANVFQKHITAL